MTDRARADLPQIASWLLAAMALLLVLKAGLLAALYSGLLVYALVHLLAPRLGLPALAQVQQLGAGGIEPEGEAGEFLLQGVVEFAGDALALVERGLMGNFALQTGDLSALKGEQNEGEQHKPAEQGDGENESAGIPKGRGA